MDMTANSTLSFRIAQVSLEIVDRLRGMADLGIGTNRAFYALMEAFCSKFPVFFVELISLFRYAYCFDGNMLCFKGARPLFLENLFNFFLRTGDAATSFWLIQSGSLEVLHPQDGVVAVVLKEG